MNIGPVWLKNANNKLVYKIVVKSLIKWSMETQKQYVLNFVFKIRLYIKTEQFLKMNYMYFKDWTVF